MRGRPFGGRRGRPSWLDSANQGGSVRPQGRGTSPMRNREAARIIPRRTPESAAMAASVKRAMAITAVLNRLTYDDAATVRAVFSDLIGKPLDEAFSLIPPFYTTGGENIRIGRNVFINQNCTMYDLGGIDIADEVMIGPNVSIITSGHPLQPSQRCAAVTAK